MATCTKALNFPPAVCVHVRTLMKGTSGGIEAAQQGSLVGPNAMAFMTQRGVFATIVLFGRGTHVGPSKPCEGV